MTRHCKSMGRSATSILLTLITLGGIVACGSDDDGGASSITVSSIDASAPSTSQGSETASTSTAGGSDNSSAPETQACGEMTPITLAIAGESMAYLDGWGAVDLGLFEKHCFEVKVLPPPNNGPTNALLVASGDADFALNAPNATLALVAADRDVRVFAGGASGSILPLILSKDAIAKAAEAGITRDSPLRDRVRFLKGLTINEATPGGPNSQQLRRVLTEAGLNPDSDLTLVSSQQNVAASQIAAMAAGHQDGFVLSPPGSLQAVSSGVGDVWLSGTDGDFGEVGYYIAWSASTDMLTNQAELAERFVGVLDEFAEILKSDPNRVQEAIRPRYADIEEDVFVETFKYVAPVFVGPKLEADRMNVVLDQFNESSDVDLDPSEEFAIYGIGE